MVAILCQDLADCGRLEINAHQSRNLCLENDCSFEALFSVSPQGGKSAGLAGHSLWH